MSPNATFMIHEVSLGAFGKLEDVKTSTKEAERLNDIIMRIMATNINKPPNYFIDMIKEKGHTNWYLNAEEAKDIGLINHIRLPRIEVKIDVDMVVH